MGNPRNNPKLSGISNKDQRALVRAARKQGATVTLAKGKPHVIVEYQGKKARLALTSSSSNILNITRSELKRIGLEV